MAVRLSAFEFLKEQVDLRGEILPRTVLQHGFAFQDRRVPGSRSIEGETMEPNDANGPGTSGDPQAPYWAPTDNCQGCGRPSLKGSYLCERCRVLMNRVDIRKDAEGRNRAPDKRARLRAMHQQCDDKAHEFRCYFTGVILNNERGSTRQATWEHLTPGEESSVVLVADLVNRMKTDMTEGEFKALVRALAQHFDGADFQDEALPDRIRRVTGTRPAE